MDHIEIYRSALRRRWRWRYVAANGHILADSGQGYSRRIDALAGAKAVTGCYASGQPDRLVTAVDRRFLPVMEVEK